MNSFKTFEILELLKSGVYSIEDKKFDTCFFPADVCKLSSIHWTPLQVAIASAKYLSDDSPNSAILDIGSGAGKFCILGSLVTDANFTGVELRKNLFELSREIVQKHAIERLTFVHGDVTNLDFSNYSGFYFYNSFAENVFPNGKIDASITLNEDNYYSFTDSVKNKLANCPSQTKLVTYCTSRRIVPNDFTLVKSLVSGKLLFWIKK